MTPEVEEKIKGKARDLGKMVLETASLAAMQEMANLCASLEIAMPSSLYQAGVDDGKKRWDCLIGKGFIQAGLAVSCMSWKGSKDIEDDVRELNNLVWPIISKFMSDKY